MTQWTPHTFTFIPVTLVECNECSALVLNHAEAKANHEGWHKKGAK